MSLPLGKVNFIIFTSEKKLRGWGLWRVMYGWQTYLTSRVYRLGTTTVQARQLNWWWLKVVICKGNGKRWTRMTNPHKKQEKINDTLMALWFLIVTKVIFKSMSSEVRLLGFQSSPTTFMWSWVQSVTYSALHYFSQENESSKNVISWWTLIIQRVRI